jgi:gliding motility-associated-like protein
LYCFTYPAQNGCDSTRCLSLALFDAPSISINVSADTLSAGDTLLLSIPQGVYESIQWYANDSLLADCTGFIACEQMPLDSSVTYTVVITDVNGCIATASVRIIVIPSCNPELAEMPNAFSPNGDQVNDVFDIVGPGSEISLHLRVWNRWGQKVYDGPGPWDGSQDGKPAASDVYIYAVKVGCALPVDDLERVLKGDVTLLR